MWSDRVVAGGCRLAALIVASFALASAAGAAEPDEVWQQIGPAALLGSGADRLEVGLGAFEPFDDDPTLQGSIEYRFGRKLGFIGPALGLLANEDDAIYGYFGLYLDLAIGPVVLTPMLAAGGYHRGQSVDLGGVFEFRSSLNAAWQFDNGHRLGVEIAHMSNANIYDSNPGAEDLMVTYAVPLGPLF
jgi:lipid A 3-O-deacylase